MSQLATSPRPTLGFVGLGLMGAAFTKRLRATGHAVIGCDVVAERLREAAAWGVEAGASPADVARRADHVLVCVLTTEQLGAVVAGPDGLSASGRQDGKVLVDLSTSVLETTRALAARLAAETGMGWIDAPVSGGPGAAEAGTLAIMAGGAAETFERVRGVLELLGHATRMGELGAGQVTKLCNQVLVLNNFCVIAEAVRLAEAHGIDPRRMVEALSTGYAGSRLLPVMVERMAARNYTPTGRAKQCLKDLEMLNDAARAAHLAMPMSAQALTLFRMLVASGRGEEDGAAVIETLPDPGAAH
jgi:3-hydroxyisobutyrate dehydrogenase-like beta-hydroxyacid dehydrogenase